MVINANLALGIVSFCSETKAKSMIYSPPPLTTSPQKWAGSFSFTIYNSSTSKRTAFNTAYANVPGSPSVVNGIITELTVLGWFAWFPGNQLNANFEGAPLQLCQSKCGVSICSSMNGTRKVFTPVKLPNKAWSRNDWFLYGGANSRFGGKLVSKIPQVIPMAIDTTVQELYFNGIGFSFDACNSTGPNTEGYMDSWCGFNIICVKFKPA